MSNQPFDAGRAMLRGADMFERFAIAGSGVPLGEARLSPRTELLVLARGAERRALLLREMAYHHLAQGELGGEPAMVSFCVICNTGVGMTPVVDGAVHHFSAGGLYDGLVLLIDDETGTYWNHITGAAVHGPLEGARLETWGIELQTVAAAAAADPGLWLWRSHRHPVLAWVMDKGRGIWTALGRPPPLFPATMAAVDTRLGQMTLGLGVLAGEARFYPLGAVGEGVSDDWHGRRLRVELGPGHHVPHAVWEDDGSRPLQLFSRWYGFVLTYPNCALPLAADKPS